jgi:hypothetical protein
MLHVYSHTGKANPHTRGTRPCPIDARTGRTVAQKVCHRSAMHQMATRANRSNIYLWHRLVLDFHSLARPWRSGVVGEAQECQAAPVGLSEEPAHSQEVSGTEAARLTQDLTSARGT